MKIYTIRDNEGVLRPQAFVSVPYVKQAIRDNVIVDVDYGMETALDYLASKNGKGCTLAICEITEL